MDNRIPALQYALFAEAFWKFATRMEKSVLEMNPYQRKERNK